MSLKNKADKEKKRNLWDSVLDAAQGWKYAWREDYKYKLYMKIAIAAFIINIVDKMPMIGWTIYGIMCLGVFSSEIANAAIEHVCDFITTERDERIKHIKDMAATPVLIWTIGFYANELVFIIKPLVERIIHANIN